MYIGMNDKLDTENDKLYCSGPNASPRYMYRKKECLFSSEFCNMFLKKKKSVI